MEQLISRLLTLLQNAGLPVIAAMPAEAAPRLQAPACAVQLTKARLLQPGFAQYLGMLEDPERGQIELYGARLSAELTIRIYSPMASGAALCMEAMGRVMDALLSPETGLTVQSLETEPCSYQGPYDHFTAAVRVSLSAWVYGGTPEQVQRFTDFNLRGELQ